MLSLGDGCVIVLEQSVMVTQPGVGWQQLGACLHLLEEAAFVGPMRTCQTQGLVTFTLLLALGGCCLAHLFGPSLSPPEWGWGGGASFTTCTVGLGW